MFQIISIVVCICVSTTIGFPVVKKQLDLTYKVDLRQPCGGSSTSSNETILGTLINADTQTLPNLHHLTSNIQGEVKTLLDKFVQTRLSNAFSFLEMLSGQPFPMTKTLEEEVPNMVQACQQKTDVLALLWSRMLEYAVYINRRTETELHWSGHYTNVPLRTTTFEEEFTQLEVVQVSSLLCGIKVVAQSHGVRLHDSIIDKWVTEQNLPATTTLEKLHEDIITFVVLNSFSRDFLQFSEEFFACLE